MENNNVILIERFLNGQLTDEETIQFNELKKNDVDFQNELSLYEQAQMVVELDALQSLKENARRLDTSSESSNKPTFQWMKIAASILLIAVVGTLFYAQNSYSNSGIYADYYQPAGDHLSDLSSGKTDLQSAMALYNTQKYSEAIDAFAQLEKAHPDNEAISFYYGQSLLLDEQTILGIDKLLQVTEDYQPEARWYAALAQLNIGEDVNCIGTLNAIIAADQDQTFVKKAKNLKAKLQSPLRKLVI